MRRCLSRLFAVVLSIVALSTSLPCFAIRIETNSIGKAIDGPSTLDPRLAHFISEKYAFAKTVDKKYQLNTPLIVWKFFQAAEKGDWLTTSNLFISLEAGSGRYSGNATLPRQVWSAVHDTYGAYEQFQLWNRDLLKKFGSEIIESIPPGSIYFGGTDTGRFVISAMSKSHNEGRPFFTVTQNGLADANYLAYLRELYEGKIHVPTTEDSHRAFEAYVKDATVRAENKQLKEDEGFAIKNGKVEVTGVVAVMLVNEGIVEDFLQKNSGRECFIEESFVLEHLYSRSLPHGLIFKIAPQPLERLPDAILEKDHQFWIDETRSLIGKVIDDKTTVSQLCFWAEKIYVREDYADFTGNRNYIKDTQATATFSKCRSAVASLYEWRSRQPAQKREATALKKEADFAYRQAVALDPASPETALRYSGFLFDQKQTNDAKLLIKTTLKINHDNTNDWGPTDLLSKLRKKAKELKIQTEP